MASTNSSNQSFSRDKLFDLKGHVALVTGGGSGIGLMATQALVANGAKVYITGRTKEKLDRVVELYSQGKDSIIPIQCDLTDKAQIADLVKQVSAKENCLCILINNAGISGSTLQTEAESAEEMKQNLFDAEKSTVEDWTDVYRTNVAQVYFATTAFLPLLQKSSTKFPGWSATVINISSISGLVKTSQHHFAYNASKGAAIHLTRMLAAETAANKLKIRINSIAPGVFPSEMTTDGSNQDQKSHIEREKYAEKVPAGRPGKDEDMAQTVLFFAVNQYLNGQTVAVDGGYTLAAGE
ncbi:NAD(P)-binding protein [Hypoxylon rubiginosum]|uniref:NAD(P)-binding protein n=1 Tax=Hypoxylon rubiginosum TaxID=110542 RepID=A0ACC0CKM3_9PEZI|nr:NAD(P)-binding protein [Hypoxylon rubiginosum]